MTQFDATRAYAKSYANASDAQLMNPLDAIRAHALGISIPETAPLSTVERARLVEPVSRTYNHDGCVTRWLQERDARERAEREALDWREVANDWFSRAERGRKQSHMLKLVVVGLGLIACVLGAVMWEGCCGNKWRTYVRMGRIPAAVPALSSH